MPLSYGEYYPRFMMLIFSINFGKVQTNFGAISNITFIYVSVLQFSTKTLH